MLIALVLLCRKLTKVLIVYLKKVEDHQYHDKIRGALKGLQYVFKFIVRSRTLYLKYVVDNIFLKLPVFSYFHPYSYCVRMDLYVHDLYSPFGLITSYFHAYDSASHSPLHTIHPLWDILLTFLEAVKVCPSRGPRFTAAGPSLPGYFKKDHS